MARARLLKPSFFTNEELATIEPFGRLLFAGLWTIADREGRLEDRPGRIRAELLPYDPLSAVEVNQYLGQLEELGFIVRYETDGKRYIQIGAFRRHQKPHTREAASEIPCPPGWDGGDEHGLVIAKAVPGPDEAMPSPKKTPGNRYTVTGNGSDPVSGDPETVPPAVVALADAAPARKRAPRQRELTPEFLDRIQADEPTLDIPAFAADYLNWDGSRKHNDLEQGFRNQLRIGWKRDQFTRPEHRARNGTPRASPPTRADEYDIDAILARQEERFRQEGVPWAQ